MQTNKINGLLILVLIFNVTFAAMCNKSTDYNRTLAKATDDFAEGQKSAANLLSNSRASGLLTETDVSEIKPILQEANSLNGEAIALGKKLLANPVDGSVKQQLIDKLNAISGALVRANNIGLFRIKDPQTKLAFSTLIATMTAAATSAIIVLKKG